MPQRPTWSNDDLRRAVNGDGRRPPARSMLEVTNRLGLTQGGPTNQVIREHAAFIGLTLPNRLTDRRREKVTRLERELAKARSVLAGGGR